MKISALEVVGKFTGLKFPGCDSDENRRAWFLVQREKGVLEHVATVRKYLQPSKTSISLKCKRCECPVHRSWSSLEVAQ